MMYCDFNVPPSSCVMLQVWMPLHALNLIGRSAQSALHLHSKVPLPFLCFPARTTDRYPFPITAPCMYGRCLRPGLLWGIRFRTVGFMSFIGCSRASPHPSSSPLSKLTLLNTNTGFLVDALQSPTRVCCAVPRSGEREGSYEISPSPRSFNNTALCG